MLSLHSVEAQICIAHAESKGCFTSLDPCSIPTYVSFESLLQIFFFSIPLSSKKKKKVSILPIFLPPSSQCASMPKMNHCIIIFLLLVSFRWLSLSARFVLACRSSLTCGAGSLLGFRSARESLFPGDTREPPALVMIPEVGSGGGRELLALEAMVGAGCLVMGR